MRSIHDTDTNHNNDIIWPFKLQTYHVTVHALYIGKFIHHAEMVD